MTQRVCKSYRVLVGLEIHVQLATRSKMFTGAASGFGAPPNTQVDAVVLGLPGTLPVMNKRAVEHAIKVGLALGCTIARHTKWDRKSYYYPDLPKNYQISQYDLPLCSAGVFELEGEAAHGSEAGAKPRAVRIRRAHLEEDAGKLLHEAPGGFRIDHSIVDLNRAGTPLLEIVTEPDLSTPRDVVVFAQELQKLVQFLGVSEAQMQMGNMRFEPNINVHITDADGVVHKTAITEIKNLNSFSVLERATAYEIRRQLRAWEETGSLGKKSTYGWDEAAESTFWQRDKEQEQDYRYFPDPDLVPVEVSDAWLAELKAQVGELPAARRKRYVEILKLPVADAAILASDRATGDFFEQVLGFGANPKRVCNLILSHGKRLSREKGVPLDQLGIGASRLAEVANLIDQDQLAASGAGAVIEGLLGPGDAGKLHVVSGGGQAGPATVSGVVSALGLLQSNDGGVVDAAIDAMIAQDPKSLQDYRAGRQQALGSLVGMVMRSVKGLNPKMVQERLKERLRA